MRTDTTFPSHGTRCAAWLYRPPAASGRVPCVVMAHGFSAVREQRLDAYAARFAQAGYAVLLFDYRGFGASDGQPRQLLDIGRQLDDWTAAVAHARGLDFVDAERIALFGSSFSGGHVQVIAARDARIAAAIAQVPFCDGLLNLPALGLANVARLSIAGLRDLAGALLGRAPYTIPAVGAPGTLAVMTTPDAVPGFSGMNPPGSTWRNEVAARIALRVGLYRPSRLAAKIACPILYSVGEGDVLTPAKLAIAASRRAPRGELKTYPCGHFGVYVPPMFERVVADQLAFLQQRLPVR